MSSFIPVQNGLLVMTRHSSWIGANMKPTAFHPGRIAKHQKDVFPGRLMAGSNTAITHEKKGK